MPELNADIPRFECLVRAEYLYDNQSHHGEFVPAIAFAVSSLEGRAIGFHVITAAGAVIYRLPISALCHKPDASVRPLSHLELWNCFSYHVAVNAYCFLQERRCRVLLKDKTACDGTYMFTLDWYGSQDAEAAGDLGHKCCHLIQLDEGNYVAQPNNRILWADPAWIAKPFEKRPDYLTNTRTWNAETETKWVTEDSNAYFYGTHTEEKINGSATLDNKSTR